MSYKFDILILFTFNVNKNSLIYFRDRLTVKYFNFFTPTYLQMEVVVTPDVLDSTSVPASPTVAASPTVLASLAVVASPAVPAASALPVMTAVPVSTAAPASATAAARAQCAVCRRNDTPLYPLELAPLTGGFKKRIFGAKITCDEPIGEYHIL